MFDTPSEPQHVVAVVGGAVSGAEATDTLVEHGIHVVVFEQNDRPYGKIEDGLPRWHDKQRSQEYRKIDGKLDRPEVTFVPRTAIGRDVAFADLAREWGFSAVLLANGAWRDRSPRVPAAEAMEGRGFYYQNPFIHWFNHHEEEGYDGPALEVADGAVVLGGGLASIDCCKVLMLETVAKALRSRGHEVDVVEMEHKGIPKTLDALGVAFEDLGLQGCTLVYRRSIGEMPVASERPNGGPDEKERVAGVRRKLIDLSTSKYLYSVREHSVAGDVVVEDDRITGLVLKRTEYQDGRLVTVEGSEETVATPLIISSIGSIPLPIEGIPMDGEYYRYDDWDKGILSEYDGVFAVGNVITGKGNIAVSRKHGRFIAESVIADYLGVGDGDRSAALADAAAAIAEERKEEVERVAATVKTMDPIAPEAVAGLRERITARHADLEYPGYAEWIEKVSPPGMR